jgi:hypothetical protein
VNHYQTDKKRLKEDGFIPLQAAVKWNCGHRGTVGAESGRCMVCQIKTQVANTTERRVKTA